MFAYTGGANADAGDHQGYKAAEKTPDRLTYNNKRIFLRGYNIVKENMMFMIQPRPAQF
jgi:hypothetical protein